MNKEQFLIPAIRAVVDRPRLADVLFRFDRWGNPFADEVFRDPYPQIEIYRQDGPVVYRPLYQQWFVFGYDEARQVFSSDHVSTRGQVDTLLTVRPYPKLTPRVHGFFTAFLLITDPPDHTRLRRLVSRAFTPGRVRALETEVRKIADDLLVRLDGQQAPEIFEGFCVHLPSNVIAEMLGIPPERWPWVRDVTHRIVKMIDPLVGFDPQEINDAVDEIWEYVGSLADERRREPKDDLISGLVAAEDEGDQLTNDELITMVGFLMGAGYETTSGLLGNAIIALAANPEQRTMLRSKPDLWPNATEELIRYDPPLRLGARVATKEIEVGNKVIPAGANILVNFLAANRDPAKFDRPDELILDRENPDPISFGHGIHHCLGAALARLELRVGLQAFLDVFGDYEVNPEAIEWRRSASLRGPTKLPVTRG